MNYMQIVAYDRIAHKVLYRRRKPYTDIGIKRLTCHRSGCNNKATRQWQICSDGNTYRPICDSCDIALNKLVLEFMGFEDSDNLISKYSQEINNS